MRLTSGLAQNPSMDRRKRGDWQLGRAKSEDRGVKVGVALIGAMVSACTCGLWSATPELFSPATVRDGQLPPMPYSSAAVGGGQVALEATVDRIGAVASIRPLRSTTSFTDDGAVTKTVVCRSMPPFDDAALGAVRRWTFGPAERGRRPSPAIVYILVGFPVPMGAPGVVSPTPQKP